jgi:predicted nucleotidyltransferase
MRPDEFAALVGRLRPVLEQHHVLKAIVFGSVARGETSRHSDLDLIVVVDTEKRFLDRYEGILRDITAAARDYDVDLLIYTPEELSRMAERPWFKTAIAEGKVIYESEQEPLSG